MHFKLASNLQILNHIIILFRELLSQVRDEERRIKDNFSFSLMLIKTLSLCREDTLSQAGPLLQWNTLGFSPTLRKWN